MIQVTPDIHIHESDLQEEFVRSSGPGGQNVNKVATAVKLRFDLEGSASLPSTVKNRLYRIAGNRINSKGFLVIDARRHRSQEQNRQEALERLLELIRKASRKPKRRKPTKPSAAARQRRLENKRRRSLIKKQRGRISRTE
ncbi:MAG: alternative ribosome rescue aminoacyl-tRNA hydrolase ArfB [Thermodesulfobacteriota bacterium]